MTEKKKTKQKTVQKTAPKKDKVTTGVVRTMKSTTQKVGRLVWQHRDYVAHYAMIACGVMLMVGGANKLVFGRFFPK